jgi:hypothetical protein
MYVSEASARALEAMTAVAKPKPEAFNSALVYLAFLGQDLERNPIYSAASALYKTAALPLC